MKIDDSVKKPDGQGVTATQTRAGTSVRKSGVSKSGSDASASVDNVHLSSQSQLSGSSVFDANKVDEIKAAIAGGQFQVNVEKVANGLINNVTDLLQTQPT